MTKQAWISRVKNLFVKSPLVSNVFFGFVLTVLEKLVEMEFACPCDAEFNARFTAAFFVVPAVLVVLLMIIIQGCKKKPCSECGEKFFYSIVPAIVWIILMFFDGRYLACAKTNWSGRFVFVPEAAPWKWCKPTNSSSSPGDELQKTLKWYFLSQVIGGGFVIAIVLVLILYVIFMCCKKQQETGNSPGQDHQEPETSVQLTIREDTTQST